MRNTRLLKKLFTPRKISNRSSQTNKKIGDTKGKIYLSVAVFLLCPLTLWGTTQNFNLAMMALTTFAIAYLGKGMRRPKPGAKGN